MVGVKLSGGGMSALPNLFSNLGILVSPALRDGISGVRDWIPSLSGAQAKI
jgi:hypothetical protein